MKNIFASIVFFVLFAYNVNAQNNLKTLEFIHSIEDSIKVYGDTMINSKNEENRFIASYRIVKSLIAILKTPQSYQHQIDTLLPIQVVYAPDNKFRIFTWYVINDNQEYRYFGAIQMNSDSLKLFPLVDYSSFFEKPEEQTVDNNNWYGALYYQIIAVKNKKETYYTLMGSNGFSLVSNKKVIDILWFNDEDQPRFGAPIIEYNNKIQKRFILEFSNDAWAAVRFVPEEDKIIYDHVAPPDENLEGFFSQYLPDGTYEGFEWKKNKWQHIDMIEYQKRQAGDVPNVQKKSKIDYRTPGKN